MSTKKQADPKAGGKGILAHTGSLVIGIAGILFVAYIFDFQGLKTLLDGYLAGLDHSARSHASQVTPIAIFALPAAATLLAAGILYILLSALASALMAPFKEAKKKKAKALARQAEEAKAAAAGVKPRAPEPMVLVRPARIDCKDISITHIATARR